MVGRRAVLCIGLVVLASASSLGVEVRGRVDMPEVCSPAVSRAVVSLELKGTALSSMAPPQATAEVALIDQSGLQFVPRVQAISLGQTVRFTNNDSETHNVHVGSEFNVSMAAGAHYDFQPPRAGVWQVVCDIHSHMRAFVLVSRSPWIQVCSRTGEFRFEGVPDGQYSLRVWHEVGKPLRQDVEVRGGQTVDLKVLHVTAPAVALQAGSGAPIRTWPQVIDRISMTLAASLDAATQPGGAKRAKRLAQDAYFGEFEASDMETAIRVHLGLARQGELEERFRFLADAIAARAQQKTDSKAVAALSRDLLVALMKASDELKRKGITDRTQMFAASAALPGLSAPSTLSAADLKKSLTAMQSGLQGVQKLADSGQADDASSTLSSVYWNDFEPIERFLYGVEPRAVRPLEAQFNGIRGEVGKGLKGSDLNARLASLQSNVETALGRAESHPAGTFMPAFAASFITILREGVEVILILAMLVALVCRGAEEAVAKVGLRAIRWGVALAIVASVLTAVGLNWLVSAAQGRAREISEGVVMLAAAGVLFYVSHWLISQSESKRWVDFLKRHAQRGVTLGGQGTLALTAFLAVYREGAETALMYQAMIGSQSGARAGLIGLAVGIVFGLVVLGAVAWVVRATSVRLPIRAFFQLSGLILLALALVFAGNGTFELQVAGILKTTPLSWLGSGIPALGLYPTVQTFCMQGLLLIGAAAAFLLMIVGREPSVSTREPKVAATPAARVGL